MVNMSSFTEIVSFSIDNRKNFIFQHSGDTIFHIQVMTAVTKLSFAASSWPVYTILTEEGDILPSA